MLLQSVISDLAKNKEIHIGGLWGSAPLYLIAQLYQSTHKDILVITEDEESADFALDDLSVFLSITGKSAPTLLLAPATGNDTGPNATQDKILFLNRLITPGEKITVISKSALFSAFPDRQQLDSSIIQIKTGQSTDRLEFIKRLLQGGYEKTLDAVHSVGEISIRGGIIDIFPFGSSALCEAMVGSIAPQAQAHQVTPLRIEWDGNRIESIRLFDMSTQLSIKTLDSVELYLAKGLIVSADSKELPLLNYFPLDTIIVFNQTDDENEETLNRRSDAHLVERSEGLRMSLRTPSESAPYPKASGRTPQYPRLYLHKIPVPGAEGINLTIESLQRFSSGFTNILKELQDLVDKAKNFHIVSQNKAEESHLKELLASNKFISLSKVRFLQGRLNEGFFSKDEGIAFISHRELFNRYRLLRQPKAMVPSRARTTETFWELQRGDFAVHTAHGIGRYLGLKRIYNSEF
ncbi:MAG: hypothetical protein AAB038_03360, partial [Planctomycetota bacterium]